jgi:uncharacterized membrane protein
MAPLQKRALYSLLIGLVLTATLVAVFIIKGGVIAFDNDEGFRYIVYAVFIGVPLVYLILVNLTLRRPTQIDERDRRIMERAPKAQIVAILLTVAGWVIALTEVYRDTGQIPVIFVTMIFISILIISTLAQSAGILIGYWIMNRNG